MQYDRHTWLAPGHQVGDKVWLLRRNIHTTRPSQKLDARRMGPFRILEVVGDVKSAFRLELPHQMRIHNVSHVSLLELYQENTFEGRVQAPPPPEEVDGVEEFQVKEVVDSKVSWRKFVVLGGVGRIWADRPDLETHRASHARRRSHRRLPLSLSSMSHSSRCPLMLCRAQTPLGTVTSPLWSFGIGGATCHGSKSWR